MASEDEGQRILREGQIGVEIVNADDPEGPGRVVIVSVSQRVIDRGYWAGFLSPEEFEAATRLRDGWEKCRLVPDMKAAALEALGRSESGKVTLRRWDRHRHAMKGVGAASALALTQIVLHDEAPWEYARRRGGNGPALLCRALAQLSEYFERNEMQWLEENDA